ncbi:hypothetical protein [Reyranella sp.]|uniref:hypothetical protein n=1 Tax=Reyranella sp. TaxID=1929291 RepID=UPI003C79CA3B
MPVSDSGVKEGFDSLAEMFRPIDPRQLYAYSKANETRQNANRLDELYRYAQDPNFDQQQFDRLGQATGRWSPQPGYGALDQADATRRPQISVANGNRRFRGGTPYSGF